MRTRPQLPSALATLERFRDAPGGSILPAIKALFHVVKLHDAGASHAIGRIGMHLDGTAKDGRDLACLG